MIKQSEILTRINAISSILLENQDIYPGLLKGNGGMLLFLSYYYKYINTSGTFARRIHELAEKMLDQSRELPLSTSLGNGYAGIGWLIHHLVSIEVLESDALQISIDIGHHCLKTLDEDISKNDFDYLYGFTGKMEVMSLTNASFNFIDKINEWFLKVVQFKDNYCYLVDNENLINLGCAHGLPSLILFLRNHNVLNSDLEEKFLNLFYKIFDASSPSEMVSIFPNTISENDLSTFRKSPPSRLGWCYGDLGVLYFLTELPRTVDGKAVHVIKELACRINSRKTDTSFLNFYADTNHYDIGFCHGLSGIYHLHNKINKSLHHQPPLTNNEFWLRLLVDNVDLVLKKVPSLENLDQQSEVYSLISGISGAGLTLISSLTDDFRWDHCLTLKR